MKYEGVLTLLSPKNWKTDKGFIKREAGSILIE